MAAWGATAKPAIGQQQRPSILSFCTRTAAFFANLLRLGVGMRISLAGER